MRHNRIRKPQTLAIQTLVSVIFLFLAGVSSKAQPVLDRQILDPDWKQVTDPKRLNQQTGVDVFGQMWMYKDMAMHVPRVFMLGIPSYNNTQNPLSVRWQAFIDSVLLEILRSQTGHELIYRISAGHYSLLASKVGFSFPLALQLDERNFLNRDPEYLYRVRRNIGNIQSGIRHEFIFTPEEGLLDSWTDQVDTTWIFVRPSDLMPTCRTCDEKFFRIFIHELAHTADAKAEWSSFSTFARTQFAKGGHASRCRAFAALSHPQIRLAFSTMRSDIVEDRILREMNLPVPSTEAQNAQTCGDRLARAIQRTSGFSKHLREEALNRQKELDSFCGEEALKLLSLPLATHFTELTATEANLALCKSLLEPEFTSPTLKRILSRGPRPRNGDSTSRTSEPLTPSAISSILNTADREFRRITSETGK
jgi:hypothetical protein